MPEDSGRPDAGQIYERVLDAARSELDRGKTALGFSGLFAGFALGATPIAYAAALVYVPGSTAKLVAALVYPVGYIAVIVGRAQLFTENTLYPAMLSLGDRSYLAATARLWAVVLAANLVGALLFALAAVVAPALPGALADEIASLGAEAAGREFATTFWAAVLAGWALALVAWLVEAAQTSIGAILVIATLTFVVGAAQLDHSVATAIEVWGALLKGEVGLGESLGWQGTTILGNALGGVLICTLLNFAQVRSEDAHRDRAQ